MKRLSILSLGLLVALAGCSVFGGREYAALKAIAKEGIDGAIEDRKAYNDTKSKVAQEIPCDMSLGAAMRLENARKKAILIELCGGPSADSQMTVGDLAALMLTLQSKPPVPAQP
jgi:hypothetical protein